MVVSVVRMAAPAGSVGKLSAFTGGLLLLLALLRPLPQIKPEQLLSKPEARRETLTQRQEELSREAQSQLEAGIAQEAAAYISNKARQLGLDVSVRVNTRISPEGIPVPAEAVFSGAYVPELAAYTEQELGIPAERQVWNEEER
jgi:stage III sporulation protein AF